MSIENSKIMGETGAVLMIVSPLAGSFAMVLGLIGFALLIVAFNGLADYYRERGIFNNMLYGGVAFIAGLAIAAAAIAIAAIGVLTVLGIPTSSWFDPSVWQAIDWSSITNWSAMAPYIGVAIGALVVFFALSVLAAVLIRRSLRTLAQKSGVAMFATCGTLLFVGAVLTIIVVGIVLLWIALILLAVAFFRLNAEPSPQLPLTNA